MLEHPLTAILAQGSLWDRTINYPIVEGNPLWRFGLVLLVLIITFAAGKTLQFLINSYAQRIEKKQGDNILSITLKCLTGPLAVFVFAVGLHAARLCLVFDNPETETIEGISSTINNGWIRIAQAINALAIAYAIYRLVDVIEFYLLKLTSKTQTKLDDMLVPVVKKSLRITIAIVAVIFIIDNILEQDVKSILLGAGVGGIAMALAAKETVANFFGSIAIFADRPFQIDDILKLDENTWANVLEVGFRSTRVRNLNGHVITIPNSDMANSRIENISARPFIRRISNITITYDSGHSKAARAVEIIKDVLAHTPEVNTDPFLPPRVYFNEFNDASLNIYMSYWVKPPDYWLSFEVSQRVNLEMMKRFEAEKIEFAFPTQTLYLKKEE